MPGGWEPCAQHRLDGLRHSVAHDRCSRLKRRLQGLGTQVVDLGGDPSVAIDCFIVPSDHLAGLVEVLHRHGDRTHAAELECDAVAQLHAGVVEGSRKIDAPNRLFAVWALQLHVRTVLGVLLELVGR